MLQHQPPALAPPCRGDRLLCRLLHVTTARVTDTQVFSVANPTVRSFPFSSRNRTLASAGTVSGYSARIVRDAPDGSLEYCAAD
jgi:hypothetical protein